MDFWFLDIWFFSLNHCNYIWKKIPHVTCTNTNRIWQNNCIRECAAGQSPSKHHLMQYWAYYKQCWQPWSKGQSRIRGNCLLSISGKTHPPPFQSFLVDVWQKQFPWDLWMCFSRHTNLKQNTWVIKFSFLSHHEAEI